MTTSAPWPPAHRRRAAGLWGAAFVVCALAPAALAQQVIAPEPTSELHLIYPRDAFADGVTGTVDVTVELDASGVVRHVAVTAPGAVDQRLAWAALGALTEMTFTPARARDPSGAVRAIPVRFVYSVVFAIDDDERRHLAHHANEHHDHDDGAHDDGHDDGHTDHFGGTHRHEVGHVPAPITVRGVVRDARGLPVVGAQLHIDGSAADDTTVTDAQGAFVMRDAPVGGFAVLVDKDGFAPAIINVEGRRADELVELTIVLEQEVASANETVVRRRRTRATIVKRQLTSSVAVLDADTVLRVRGRTLADSLTQIAGVTMVQAGPAVAKPVVRGLFGRRIVVMHDGVRLEGQDWGVDHAPELDAHSAGELAVIKGAAGVRFGADAIGGVVLVEPRLLREAAGMDGEVTLIGVDNGYRGTIAGRLDVVPETLPQLALRIEGNMQKGAAVSAPDYVLGNTFSEALNVGVTAAWRGSLGSAPWETTASYRRHATNLGICFCLKMNTPADLEAATTLPAPIGSDTWQTVFDLGRPQQQVRHDTALLRSRLELDSIGYVTVSYAVQRDLRDEFDQVRASVLGPQYSFELVTHSADAVLEHARARLGALSLVGVVGARGDVQLHAYQGIQLIPNFSRVTGGVFALETLTVDDVAGLFDLDVTAGARADALTQTAFLTERAFDAQVRRGRITTNDCTVADGVARCDKGLPATSLTLGSRLRFDLVDVRDALMLAVDVSTATRFADVDELYLGGRAPSFPVVGIGDAGLETERTTQVSLSAELRLPIIYVEAGAFVSRIDDYIAFGPEMNDDGTPHIDVLSTGAFPRFSYRATDALLSGVDGGIVVGHGQLLSLGAQFATVRGLDVTSGGLLPFIPPTRVRLELRSFLPPLSVVRDATGLALLKPQAAIGVTAVAHQDRFDATTDFVVPAAASTVWHADASAEVAGLFAPLWVSVEVRNATNERYRDQLSLLRYFADQPGREVWLRATSRFDAPF